jgi:hypothetical protein
MEETMLKKLSMLAAAAAFAAMLAPAAQALTAAPLTAGTDVIQVAGGCGPGFHRGAYGRCYPNRAVRCRSVRTQYGWRRVCD